MNELKEMPKGVEGIMGFIHHHICDAPDKDSPDHECQGVLTVTRKSVKAECPKCGSCIYHNPEGLETTLCSS